MMMDHTNSLLQRTEIITIIIHPVCSGAGVGLRERGRLLCTIRQHVLPWSGDGGGL